MVPGASADKLPVASADMALGRKRLCRPREVGSAVQRNRAKN
jgi:hypothetical protein